MRELALNHKELLNGRLDLSHLFYEDAEPHESVQQERLLCQAQAKECCPS